MNRCGYCQKELTRAEFGWNVCECEKAQKEWTIQMEIQQYKKRLSELNKELGNLKDEPTPNSSITKQEKRQ